jgi:hypothetical protein
MLGCGMWSSSQATEGGERRLVSTTGRDTKFYCMPTASIVSPERRAYLSLETDKKEVSMLLRIMRRIPETEMTQKMGRGSSRR